MHAKTAAQRKQEERDRQRIADRVVVQVWVDPRDRERLRRYIQRLHKERKP